VPFTIRNYAYIDGCGCETVTWIREFATSTPRRFDAYLIYSEQRGKLVDYLGTHQHLAVDIDLAVDDRGGLKLRSGEQRFYEGPIAFNFPMVLSGVANVCEWFEESDGKFHIEVDVRNALWGRVWISWLVRGGDAQNGYRAIYDAAKPMRTAGVTRSEKTGLRDKRQRRQESRLWLLLASFCLQARSSRHERQRARQIRLQVFPMDYSIEHSVFEQELAPLKPIRQFLPDGLLDHSGTGKADERSWLCNV